MLFSLPLGAQALNPIQIQGMEATVILEGGGSITGQLQPGQEIVLSVLSFQDTESQQILELKEELFLGGQTITADTELDGFGNRYAVFRITEAADQDFNYRLEARIRTSAGKNLEDYSLSRSITEKQNFLEATSYIESNKGTIRSLSQYYFTSDSALETLAEVTSWVKSYVSYNPAYAGKIVPSTEVLRERQGVCDEYANLAAAILRAKGIPTRFVVGLAFSGERQEYHAWLQAFLPGQGWLDVDPTYNQAGVVDGSHLFLGAFEDHSQAVDKAVFPQNIDLELGARTLFQPGLDQNNIQIHDFDYYPEFLALDWQENIDLYASRLTDLNFKVTNQSADLQLVSLTLDLHHDFEAQNTDRIILLQPGQSQSLSFPVLPAEEVPEGTFTAYDYLFETPAQTAAGKLNVYPAVPDGRPLVEVTSIIPLIGEEGIELLLELRNYSLEKEDVCIELKKIRSFDESLAPQSSKTFVYVLPTNLSQVTVSVTGEHADFEATLPLLENIPLEGEIVVADDNQPQLIEDENILYVSEKFQQELLLNALTYGIAFVVVIAVVIVILSLVKCKPEKKGA